MGARPTRLILACQLIRYSIDFVILDRKGDITDLSKAIAVQEGTLELYEQLDLEEMAVERGIARGVKVLANDEIRASPELSGSGKNLSPFSFALLPKQSKN